MKWRLPKTYANNIHKTVVPAFEFKTSRNLHHKIQRRGFSTTWSTSWLFWNIQLAKNPLFPTVSDLVNMTKPSQRASSCSQIFGRREKFWQILTIWKIIQLITVLLSRELTHEERIIEKKLLKKRRDLTENGTKRASIRIRNLTLYVHGNEQSAKLWQPTYFNLMLINARSVKKPNAVFHLSTDLAAQSIDWCFVTES